MKHALITGITSPIGLAIAESLYQREQKISISGVGRSRQRWSEKCNGLKDKEFTRVNFIEFDFSDKQDSSHWVSELEPLNYIVLNAGVLKRSPLRVAKVEDIENQWMVNVHSILTLLSSLIRQKKIVNGASIVVVSSIATLRPTVGNVVYSTTKSALSGLVRSLSLELAPKGIRINAVLPGLIVSDMTKNLMDAESYSRHISKYPLGRFGRPEDVASLISFLLSEASSWITGTEIPIDGGYSIGQ